MRIALLLAVLLLAGCDTTPTTTHWEYTSVSGNFSSYRLREVLSEKSDTEWELVAAPVQQNDDVAFIFKRPVTAK